MLRFFFSIRQRNDAHHLREIGVARSPDQQTADVAARLFRIRPKPGPRSIAASESTVLHDRCLGHASLHFALTANIDLGEIATRSTLIDPKPATTICWSAVHKGIPIDVSNVT